MYQERLAEVRRVVETFHNELRILRRTVAAPIGRNDKDYQKLGRRAGELGQDTDCAPEEP